MSSVTTAQDVTQAEAYKNAYRKNLPLRNKIGWILNSISLPDYSRYYDRLVGIGKTLFGTTNINSSCPHKA